MKSLGKIETKYCRALAAHPNGEHLLVADYQQIGLFSWAGAQGEFVINSEKPVTAAAISRSGTHAAFGDSGGHIFFLDCNDAQLEQKQTAQCNNMYIATLALDDDSAKTYVCGPDEDGSVYVFKQGNDNYDHVIPGHEHDNVFFVSLLEENRLLVCSDFYSRLVDLDSGKDIWSMQHKTALSAASVDAGGTILVTGNIDGGLQARKIAGDLLWQVDETTPIDEHPADEFSSIVHMPSGVVVAASASGLHWVAVDGTAKYLTDRDAEVIVAHPQRDEIAVSWGKSVEFFSL